MFTCDSVVYVCTTSSSLRAAERAPLPSVPAPVGGNQHWRTGWQGLLTPDSVMMSTAPVLSSSQAVEQAASKVTTTA